VERAYTFETSGVKKSFTSFFLDFQMQEELEENRKQLSSTQNGNQFDAFRMVKKRKVATEEVSVPLVEEKEEVQPSIPEIIPSETKESSCISYCHSNKAER
jgi:hypothetical protein